MIYSAKVINIIGPYVLPVFIAALATTVGAFCLVFALKLIRRQIKLYHSITLVQLKSTKLHFYAFMIIIAFFIVFVSFQMMDAQSPEVVLLGAKLSMSRIQVNIMLAFLIIMMLCIEFLLTVLARSKCAVVDKGIYTVTSYLEWYHVHDYLIDEKKCAVILTSKKESFSTLDGTTSPLRVAKNDISKLKFILNKNKNKFSGFPKNNLN